MVSVSALNEEQIEKLTQFQTVTQIRDNKEALDRLIEHNWNLERAIQHVYDGNSINTFKKREDLEQEVANSTAIAATPAINDLRNRASSNSDTIPTITNANLGNNTFSNEIRNSISATRQPPLLFSILLWPFGLAWNLTWSLLSFANRFLSLRPTITAQQQQQHRKKDPRVLANEFIQAFESKYGTQHIHFFKGGYLQALEKARNDLQFMMVLLQSEDHDDTNAFCRNVLNSPQLIDFVKGNNILVWAGDVRESEAHKVSSTLQAATFPFMALIALQQPRVGSSSAAPKMGVLARIEGCQQYNNVELLIQQLESTMDRHGAVINRLRHERKQREMERQLLSDQDKAYRKSLKADQEKARKAKEEKERQERSERERLEKEKQKELLEKKRQQYIRYLYTHLPVEPTENVARISFRLADGARVVRKFAKTDTLESLYQFVEAYPLIKEAESIEEEKSKPDNYKHQYKFKIVSPYPRMEYEPDDTKEIHTVSSLWPSATLVVDAADEDEDVDENNEDNAIDTTTSVGNSV